MNKQAYLKELKRFLMTLPQEEIDAAITFYEEYFNEAGEENEAQVIKDLGLPSKLAAQIKADIVIRNTNTETDLKERKHHSLWKVLITVILGIFALPIALPFFIVFCVCILVFFFVLGVLLFIACMMIFACSVAGIAVLMKGFYDLINLPSYGILNIGIGLVTLGISCIIFIGVYYMFSKILPACIRFCTNIYQKKKGEQNDEKENDETIA